MIGNCTYLPALSPSVFKDHLSNMDFDKARKLLWWDDEGFIKHKSLLISAYYGMGGKNKEATQTRKLLHVPEDGKLYGDSGGFQSFRLGKIITNKTIFDWYETNCDYGFVQDFPEEFLKMKADIKNKGLDIGENETFKRMGEMQFESNKEFLKQKFTKCKIYNILHGRNLEQMDQWFKTVHNDKFYGWSTAIKPPDVFRVAFALMFLHSRGIKKNIHVLGCSGFDVIPLIIYATKYIDNITFDSTSWSMGSIYRWYFLPMDLRKKVRIGDVSGGRYTKLPCGCPVCRSIKNTELMYSNKSVVGTLISLHNLYLMLEYIKRLKGLMQVEADFKAFSASSFDKEVSAALEYIDMAAVDFDKANRKFMGHLNMKRSLFETRQGHEQLSIMDELYPEEDKPKKKKKKLVNLEGEI